VVTTVAPIPVGKIVVSRGAATIIVNSTNDARRDYNF